MSSYERDSIDIATDQVKHLERENAALKQEVQRLIRDLGDSMDVRWKYAQVADQLKPLKQRILELAGEVEKAAPKHGAFAYNHDKLVAIAAQMREAGK